MAQATGKVPIWSVQSMEEPSCTTIPPTHMFVRKLNIAIVRRGAAPAEKMMRNIKVVHQSGKPVFCVPSSDTYTHTASFSAKDTLSTAESL